MGLIASSSASDEETQTLKGGNNTLFDIAVSLCVSVFLRHMLLFYESWWSPSQQPDIVAWLSSCFKIMLCFLMPVPSWTPATSPRCSRAIQTMEKSVFPISGWFALPCTPPHLPLPCGLASKPLPLGPRQNITAHLIGSQIITELQREWWRSCHVGARRRAGVARAKISHLCGPMRGTINK